MTRDSPHIPVHSDLATPILKYSTTEVGLYLLRASLVARSGKNLPANSEAIGDVGWIPGLGRTPEGGKWQPLQYSCLENPMDRGVW